MRDNVEFSAIKSILGLQHGSSYHKADAGKEGKGGDRSLKSLRYGKVVLMSGILTLLN